MCTMQQGSASVNSGRHQFFDVIAFDSLGQPQMTVGEGLPLQAAISRSLGFNANPGRFIAAVVPSQGDKPGNAATEAPSVDPDASAVVDDSGAIEAAEDAGGANLANDSEAGDQPEQPERNRRVIVMRGSGELDIVSGLLTDDEACEEAEKFAGVEAVYTACDWTTSEVASSESRVHPDDGAVKQWELADLIDDYTRLPAIGLQAGLLRHLDVVTKAIQDGKVDCVADIGIVAKSLKRFAAQCVERQVPVSERDGWQWTSDEFEAGRLGEWNHPALAEALDCAMDEALERDWPELFEDAEAGA